MKFWESYWPAILLAGGFGFWGLNWGLPSAERTKLFLRPELNTPAFFEKVAQAREEYYSQIGINPMAHVGRRTREGKSYEQTHNILSSYSSFLIRTHHGDEQASIVMLSHLNPLQGRWYPYTFGYGGAYVYSLAAYLGTLHVLHLIRLVPQVVYYYANPDEMGKVFLATRSWSVIGLMFSIIPLFYLARRLGGARIALWATCVYALLPATIGTAKMAKPHVWAAAWIFATLYAALRSKEEPGFKWLALAGAFYGLALGTNMSQSSFFPLLIWAAWTPSWKATLLRAGIVGLMTAVFFSLTNFYLYAHLQDFRDEVYFYSHYAPLGFRWGAFGDLLFICFRPSFGTAMWLVAIFSTGWAVIQKDHPRLRQLGILALIIFATVACQVQSQNGDPVASRLCLALLGLICVFIAITIQKLPKAAWLMTAALFLLTGKAILYDLHFISDRAPHDNASLAGIWITQNIPAGKTLSHCQTVPHVIDFPPVDFERYKIISFEDPAFVRGDPMFAVIPDWAVADWKQKLLDHGFKPIKRFAESPLQRKGYSDPFTTANFALELYQRGS